MSTLHSSVEVDTKLNVKMRIVFYLLICLMQLFLYCYIICKLNQISHQNYEMIKKIPQIRWIGPKASPPNQIKINSVNQNLTRLLFYIIKFFKTSTPIVLYFPQNWIYFDCRYLPNHIHSMLNSYVIDKCEWSNCN